MPRPVVEVFADLAGDFDYPMFIVTTAAGDDRAGCLVGFTTPCSIDPPRFLAGLSKANHTYAVACSATTLVVHAVLASQMGLARLFGEATGDHVDKFAACSWRPGPGGAPVLLDCPTWFAGRILDRFDLGDHDGFLLEPVEASHAPGAPLLFFSAVQHLVPGHRA